MGFGPVYGNTPTALWRIIRDFDHSIFGRLVLEEK